jgi:hypothetical protein
MTERLTSIVSLTKINYFEGSSMLNKIFRFIFLFFSYIALSQAESDKLPSNIALHIAKTHYLHPVLLLHPYINIWHMKGPLAEKVAMTAMQKHFSNVNECEENTQATVVVLLEPHIFYNAQLQVFHAEYIARVYTGADEPITRIKKQAQQIGPITISPEFYIEKAYTKAIDKVIDALMNDQAFKDSLNNHKQIDAGKLCDKLDLLPLDKLYY